MRLPGIDSMLKVTTRNSFFFFHTLQNNKAFHVLLPQQHHSHTPKIKHYLLINMSWLESELYWKNRS